MVDDHEDYETGAAPAAHKVSHQDGGTDEISVAGLSGETATLAAHKILPSIHHTKFTAAEARAAIGNIFGSDGKADVNINLDTHRLINVVDPVNNQDADTKIARATSLSAHAILPTVHQNAPTLIENHRLAAGAHHGRYTDAEARAVHSPISIPSSAFVPSLDTYDWYIFTGYVRNRSILTAQEFVAGVQFPPGVTVSKVTFYGLRNNVGDSLILKLRRVSRVGAELDMATITADWTTGWSSKYEETIANPVIDNDNYSYSLNVSIDPNVAVDSARLQSVKIEFTG